MLRKYCYHKYMLQINGEIYFKSFDEKYALTFPVFTVWCKIINVYIFFDLYSFYWHHDFGL